MEAVGTIVPLKQGDAKVVRRIMMTSYPNIASSYYECELPDGTLISVSEGIVHAVMAGTYVKETDKPKGARKVSTKKERAKKHVLEMQRKRASRGEIIKVLAQKLRCSKATASTYYYSVR